MQRIYSHADPAMVQLVKNELEHHGIQSVIQGEHLAGSVGMIAPIETWLELWVEDDGRLQEAARVVQELIDLADVAEGAPWTCMECGEEVGPQFALCWNCGYEQPAERI